MSLPRFIQERPRSGIYWRVRCRMCGDQHTSTKGKSELIRAGYIRTMQAHENILTDWMRRHQKNCIKQLETQRVAGYKGDL